MTTFKHFLVYMPFAQNNYLNAQKTGKATMKLGNVYQLVLVSVFLLATITTMNNNATLTLQQNAKTTKTMQAINLQIAEGGIGGSGVIATDTIKSIHA